MPLRRAVLLLTLISSCLYAQSPSLENIAALDDADERRSLLEERASAVETLEGRLMLLEEARALEPLRRTADEMRIDLLLLSGRTAEAETLLQSQPETDAELALRLALVHGEKVLPEESDAGADGVDRAGIRRLTESSADTPEAFAARRGILVSAGLLLSAPEKFPQPETPAILPPPSSGGNGTAESVTIQVGAFASEANARSHLRYLESRGITGVTIRAAEVNGATLYRTVLTGIAPGDAQRVLVELKERRVEGFLLN